MGFQKGHTLFKGRKHTKEAKQKMSEAGKGRKHTEESKRKISEGLKGRICSFKTRQKISKANKGSKRTKEAKRKISIGHMKCRIDGYCDAWSDPEYKNDLRKTACEGKNCGITNHLCFHMFGKGLDLHHINGNKKDCRPQNFMTLCCSCHPKIDRRLKND